PDHGVNQDEQVKPFPCLVGGRAWRGTGGRRLDGVDTGRRGACARRVFFRGRELARCVGGCVQPAPGALLPGPRGGGAAGGLCTAAARGGVPAFALAACLPAGGVCPAAGGVRAAAGPLARPPWPLEECPGPLAPR